MRLVTREYGIMEYYVCSKLFCSPDGRALVNVMDVQLLDTFVHWKVNQRYLDMCVKK